MRCTTCDPDCVFVKAKLLSDRCAWLQNVRDLERCLLALAVQDHRGPALGLHLVGLVARQEIARLMGFPDLAGRNRSAYDLAPPSRELDFIVPHYLASMSE